MRALLKSFVCCALCVFIALLVEAEGVCAADFQVRIASADGDQYRDEDADQAKREISLEWAQLQTRLVELEKSVKVQTDQRTYPESIFVGHLLSHAMERVIVLRPARARRLIGIVPQPPMNGRGRSIAFYNISYWVENGRKLDAPSSNKWIVAVLDDEAMRGSSGAQFVVDQVRYVAKFENDRLGFRRVTSPP